MQWTSASDVSGLSGVEYPCLATHRGELHAMCVKGQDLCHGQFDQATQSWTFQQLAETTQSKPAIISYNGKLTLVYAATGNNSLYYAFFDDTSQQWSAPALVGSSSFCGGAPAVHSGLLYFVFSANNSSRLLMQCTFDGNTWSTATQVSTGLSSVMPTALQEYNDELHLAFVVNDSSISHSVLHYVLVDATAMWEPSLPTGQSSGSAIALLVYNRLLCLMFSSNNSGYGLELCASDGTVWTAPMQCGPSGAFMPAAITWNGQIRALCVQSQSYALQQFFGVSGDGYPYARLPLAGLSKTTGTSVQSDLPTSMFSDRNPYTIEAWVCVFSDPSPVNYIATAFDSESSQGLVAIVLDSTKRIQVCRGDSSQPGGTGIWITSKSSLPEGEWVHVAVAFNPATSSLTLYLNGLVDAIGKSPGSAVTQNPLPFLMGAALNSTSSVLAFNLRWVAVWNTARTDQEIVQDMFSEPAPQSNLLALFDYSQLPPRDVSGFSQSITVYGSLQPILVTEALVLRDGAYVDCGCSELLNFDMTQPFTISTWLLIPELPSGTDSYTVISQPAQQFSINIASSGYLTVNTQCGWGGLGTQTVVTGKWFHFCVTYWPMPVVGGLRLYINGTLQGNGGINETSATSPGNTYIGSAVSGQTASQFFTGSMANVQFWNVTLPPEAVRLGMGQCPIGMKGLVANYDFSSLGTVTSFAGRQPVPAVQDLTMQNPAPQLISSATLASAELPFSAQSMQGMFELDTDIATPYYPDDTIEPIQLTAEMFSQAGLSDLPSASWVPFSESQRDRMVEEFRSAQPSTFDPQEWEQFVKEKDDLVDRLFDAARKDPDALRQSRRFQWKRVGGQDVLQLITPEQSYDLAVADAGELSLVQMWWVEFAVELLVGLFAILLPLVGSRLVRVSKRVVKFIKKNPKIVALISTSFSVAQELTAKTVIMILASVYANKLLVPLLKEAAVELGFFGLISVCVLIAELAIPGGQALLLITLFAGVAELVVNLTYLITQYPDNDQLKISEGP